MLRLNHSGRDWLRPRRRRRSRLSSIVSARNSASFAGVGIEQVVGIVAFIKRTLLAELERRVALFNRGLAILVPEAGHGRQSVGCRRWLVEIHKALAARGTALVFNGEGLRSGHNIKRREKRGSNDESRGHCVQFHGGLDG